MRSETYRARNGAIQHRPVLTEQQYWRAEDGYRGFCLACGATRGECEPDARQYACEACGKEKVYGIPELMIMGLVRIERREGA